MLPEFLGLRESVTGRSAAAITQTLGLVPALTRVDVLQSVRANRPGGTARNGARISTRRFGGEPRFFWAARSAPRPLWTDALRDATGGGFAKRQVRVSMDLRTSALNLAHYPPARLIELARLQEACGYEIFLYTDERFFS
jgi:hypothetical protein